MGSVLFILLGLALAAPRPAVAATIQTCGVPGIHYLLVRPTEDLAGGPDQEVFLALAKETKAQFTAITPDELNTVPKDPYRQSYVHALLSNIKEIRRRIKITRHERELESLVAQKDRHYEELRSLQPERQVAVRQLVKATVKSIKEAHPQTRIILLYSGHGLRCPDGKEWCAEVAPGQMIRESEWMQMAQADGAIFDSNFMATGMDLYAQPSALRVYGVTTDTWDLEEAGKGLISTALYGLMTGSARDLCALDTDRDGKVGLSELSGFLASAYQSSKSRKPLAPLPGEAKPAKDICLFKPVAKTCPPKMQMAKFKFDRLWKHPEVLPPIPVQRAPSSVTSGSKLDKQN